jgi:hypothetical protein
MMTSKERLAQQSATELVSRLIGAGVSIKIDMDGSLIRVTAEMKRKGMIPHVMIEEMFLEFHGRSVIGTAGYDTEAEMPCFDDDFND